MPERRNESSAATPSPRLADLRGVATNLRLVLDIIGRSEKVTARRIYGDMPSPRLDLLLLADVPMHLARFYLGLAKEAARAY